MVLRLAVLTSASAPGIETLLADPNRGSVYELSAVVSSETDVAQARAIEAARVPLIQHPIHEYHRKHHLPLRNLHARENYDRELADIFGRLGPDYIFVDGYHYILTAPLLQAFPNRVIGLIDSDLTVSLDAGLHSVRNAILGGAHQTRSSAYVLTEDVGAGPLFLISGSYPVAPMARDAWNRGDADFITRYAALHRQWMLRDCWGRMLARIAELLAAGSVTIVQDVVWIDGVPGPCRFGEAPDACHEAHVQSGIPGSCPFIAAASSR